MMLSKKIEEFRGDQNKQRRKKNPRSADGDEEKRREREMRKEERRFWKTNFPKLDIIMFDSAHFDWFRFWNQFESQIDKCDLPQVSNFLTLRS